IIGSQAILGQFPNAPDSLRRSVEADIYPKNKPDLADLIDGSIGELSPFHETFGYYAHGVGAETVVLPQGWQQRLVAVRNDNTAGVTGWCLEVHDLLISKYVAGRDRDLDFAAETIKQGLVRKDVLLDRVRMLPLEKSAKDRLRKRIRACFGPRADDG
ncbi:MAG: hypothetical protein JSW39_21015, partial [Desulfobacterales bacterium]